MHIPAQDLRHAGTASPWPPAFGAEERCAVCRSPVRTLCRVGARLVCGAQCAEQALGEAVAAELAASSAGALRTGPKLRIGEILVERGVITEEQLERALRSQRLTGAGRLGNWLRELTQLPDREFAAALAIQWECAVYSLAQFAPEAVAALLPRTLIETLDALPLRMSGEGEHLILCFEDRPDRELVRACGRMHGVSVEGGLLPSHEFWHGSRQILRCTFPPSVLVRAADREQMISAVAACLFHSGVFQARMVYVRGHYWVRFWTRTELGGTDASVRDLLCLIEARGDAEGGSSALAAEIRAGLGLPAPSLRLHTS